MASKDPTVKERLARIEAQLEILVRDLTPLVELTHDNKQDVMWIKKIGFGFAGVLVFIQAVVAMMK